MKPKYIEFYGKHPAAEKEKRQYQDRPRKNWNSYGASYSPDFLKLDIDDFSHKTGQIEEPIHGKPRSDAIVAILDSLGIHYNGILTEHGKQLYFRVPDGMEKKTKPPWYCPLGIKCEWKFPASDDHIPLKINGVERKFFKGSITNEDVDELPPFLYPLQKSKNTELLNKQFVNAGTEAAGIDSVMLQLTQSMAAGVMQGEELNAIMDNASIIVQDIQRYLQEVQGIDASNIKELASEGVVTAEVIKNAMFYAADETNAKFETMPKTFGQVWQSFQNTALMAFQTVLNRMNDFANSEAFNAFIMSAQEAMLVLAGIVTSIFDMIGAIGTFAYENWSIISPIIWGIIGALAIYAAYLAITKAAELASAAGKIILCVASYAHAAATGAEASATAAATAAQYGFNAALLACPITWIIILIIALIALFYAAVAAVNKFAGTSVSATGIIAGAFAVLGAHIINTFIVPVQNMIATFVNFLGNVFNDPIAAIKVAFYDMCLTVIGYIRNLASAIETLLNKIPGVTVDITSGLDSFYAGLEQAQQAVKDESGWVEYVQKMDYIDYADAASAGYSFGEGIDESISNFDPSSLFDTNVPSASDYADLSNYGSDLGGLGGIGSGVDDIAGNTGAIADSMDITEEDLKYLRDIAEQEAINRFTTAEIYIDQSGMQNNISNGMDLDGVISGLTEGVNEAIDSMAEGVHD